MFVWDENRIYWMQRAAFNCEYHAQLAQNIAEHVADNAHVCDAGCGLGFLSLALSKHVRQVSAVDRSAVALSVLRQNIAVANIANIHVIEDDMKYHTPSFPYDAMVFCFYGRMAGILPIVKRICSDTVIFIKADTHGHGIVDERKRTETVEDAAKVLENFGIPYKRKHLILEYGQPFDTLDEAKSFFKHYNDGEYARGMDRVVEVQGRPYRYYLPYQKKIGMLAFQTAQVPQLEVNLD